MQFKEGTTVYTNDGEKVGDIERFILDPRGQQIIGLVVREGFLFTTDKVIPVNMVRTADAEKVVLYATVGDPESFPEFEEVHYVTPDTSDLSEEYTATNNFPLYYYPPYASAPGWYGGGFPHPETVSPQVPVKERNIPAGTVPIKEGANVISRDGEHVGDVERVFTDSKSDEITHFAIAQGLLFKEEKLLPSIWVETAREDEVHLAVGSKTLEKLGDF